MTNSYYYELYIFQQLLGVIAVHRSTVSVPDGCSILRWLSDVDILAPQV